MLFLCHPFAQLSVDQLYAILSLRAEIFVVEQRCIYLDTDGKDQDSWHLMGFDEGRLVAYTRLVPQGLSYPEAASIGRVIVALEQRGKGLGKALMEESVRRCRDLFGPSDLKISAQWHLEAFYRDLGFEPTGQRYLEDGLPHQAMVRRDASPSS